MLLGDAWKDVNLFQTPASQTVQIHFPFPLSVAIFFILCLRPLPPTSFLLLLHLLERTD